MAEYQSKQNNQGCFCRQNARQEISTGDVNQLFDTIPQPSVTDKKMREFVELIRRFNIFARLGLAVVSAVIGMIAISCIILAIAGDK